MMKRRSLTYGQEQLRLPFPLAWYEREGNLVTRSSCEKQLRLAESIGEAATQALMSAVARRLRESQLSGLHAGFADDGRPILRTMGISNLRDNLDEIVMGTLSSISAPDDLRQWVTDDVAQMRDLTGWFTVYRTCDLLFEESLITTDLADEHERVFEIAEDSRSGYAMAAADVVIFARHNEGDLLIPGLFVALGSDRQSVQPPPWTA